MAHTMKNISGDQPSPHKIGAASAVLIGTTVPLRSCHQLVSIGPNRSARGLATRTLSAPVIGPPCHGGAAEILGEGNNYETGIEEIDSA